ncbi:hypothetical protein [Brevundimonas kwangchunensis]
MKIDKTAKAAVVAIAIAVSSISAAVPASAGTPVKDCAGDAARFRLSSYFHRVTGLSGFFGFAFDASSNRKYFSCK